MLLSLKDCKPLESLDWRNLRRDWRHVFSREKLYKWFSQPWKIAESALHCPLERLCGHCIRNVVLFEYIAGDKHRIRNSRSVLICEWRIHWRSAWKGKTGTRLDILSRCDWWCRSGAFALTLGPLQVLESLARMKVGLELCDDEFEFFLWENIDCSVVCFEGYNVFKESKVISLLLYFLLNIESLVFGWICHFCQISWERFSRSVYLRDLHMGAISLYTPNFYHNYF